MYPVWYFSILYGSKQFSIMTVVASQVLLTYLLAKCQSLVGADMR